MKLGHDLSNKRKSDLSSTASSVLLPTPSQKAALVWLPGSVITTVSVFWLKNTGLGSVQREIEAARVVATLFGLCLILSLPKDLKSGSDRCFFPSNVACVEYWSLPKKSKVSYQDMSSFYQSVIHSIINNKDFIFSIGIIHHWLVKVTSHRLAAVKVWHLGTAVLHDPWSSLSVLASVSLRQIGRESGPERSLLQLTWRETLWSGFGQGSETSPWTWEREWIIVQVFIEHLPCPGRQQPGQQRRNTRFGVQVAGVSLTLCMILGNSFLLRALVSCP